MGTKFGSSLHSCFSISNQISFLLAHNGILVCIAEKLLAPRSSEMEVF